MGCASVVGPEVAPELPQEEWAAKPHLTNSRALCWDRRAATPAAQSAVDALMVELEATLEHDRF